jgi:hypothetical protein
MTMTKTSKLTPEDLTWLESRISRATPPVQPSREFVDRARDELMQLHVDPPRRRSASVLIGIIFSGCALIAALLLVRRKMA